jgi:hypothetical protein
VDEIYQQLAPHLHRPGPAPTTLSDRAMIALAIIGECRGWDIETELLGHAPLYRQLFPHLSSHSRFNRRRRHVLAVCNLIRRMLLRWLDVAQDATTGIDRLPIAVVGLHLAPESTAAWDVQGATLGHVASNKQTISGYKLHLLVTLGGEMVDFELAPAKATDLEVGAELWEEHTDLTTLGDKASISRVVQARLRSDNRVHLLTLPRRNPRPQLPSAVRQTLNQVRQIIETVNGQLTAQFKVEANHAHTFRGLGTRLYTTLTAHTLGIYLNRFLGNADCLQIKHLAFPI